MVWPDLVAPPKYKNPAPGWEDPRLPDIRLIWKLAREVGYAVGVHGSLVRDFDLIAVPWAEDAISQIAFIKHMERGLEAKIEGRIAHKPHGRLGVILSLDAYVKPIDLSVMPTNKGSWGE